MLLDILLANSIRPNLLYLQRYIKLIDACQTKNFSGLVERHHIVPRSFGGKEGKNLIKLPPRYHYLAHFLLSKGTNSPKMIKAFHRMVFSRSGDAPREYVITSRVYEYLRVEHSQLVSGYSKNTVVVKDLTDNINKRIPLDMFYKNKDTLYVSISKNREDNTNTRLLKSLAAKRKRTVKKNSEIRINAASKYSYHTPKGYCNNSKDLLNLYPTFTKSTLLLIEDNFVISKKFANSHPEFIEHIGKKLIDIGIKREYK